MAPQVVAHLGARTKRRLTALVEHTISPAGDPFYAAGREIPDHFCYGGYVYIGRMVESNEDLDGEVEVIEAVACRRCEEKGS
jgi:hypothetical protein